jgi:acylphosphatase
VGFRAFVRNQARRIGLTGWVRNVADGRVELRAWGTSEMHEQLAQCLRQGPPAAEVTEVEQMTVDDHNAPLEFRIL